MTYEPPSSDPSRSSYPEYQPPPAQPVPVSMPASKPYVTYTLLAINITVFVLQFLGEALLGFDLLRNVGMKVNELILRGEYWRLFTPMFLHGSILHLGFNMYALFIFGPGLERYYRHGRFLLLFVLSGLAGNIFSFMFTSSPSLGSSTAIFGLLAAEGVFLYQNQQLFGGVARRALYNLIVIGIINLVIGLSSPGIDNWGHMGGLLGGAIFAWLGGPVLKREGIYPNYQVVDSRESRDVFVAAVIDIVIFAFLAFGTVFLWS